MEAITQSHLPVLSRKQGNMLGLYRKNGEEGGKYYSTIGYILGL